MNPPSIDQRPPVVENKKSLAEEFTKEEIIKGLSIPDKGIIVGENIEIQKIPRQGVRSQFVRSLLSDNVLEINISLFRKENDRLEDAGDMTFCLGEQINGEIIFFGSNIYLVEGNEGLGLDLECQREFFCKKHGIQTIYNRAASGRGNVGAYVWAQYGYEFADESQIENLRTKFYYFAIRQGVIITTFLENLKRPIDFALAKGVPRDGGEEVEIGKIFLLNKDFFNDLIEWHGKRDLTPGSQGTKDFIAYLKKRKREDLIEKYYADEK